nr:LysM peptidoglycan-binding domain-containing protein [Paenibacillus soyae]
MCIVQREETLEQIALRYSLNPREILIHNGLHESSVAEGQLLYIPR